MSNIYDYDQEPLSDGYPDEEDDQEFYDQSESDEGCDFADPGGNSALRAETPDNPRNLPCPNCGRENMLTPADRTLHYQCDGCADAVERGGSGYGEY